ncbi:MAG: pyridoxamine 5'-phosphate oxidase family protein [Candidatus Dormibacterales bacterium]
MSNLEVLSDSECVKLLRAHSLGRLAMTDHNGRPEIFPINYFFDEGLVVFRTDPGTKLDLAPGAQVAFEIDGWDAETATAWSVIVKGISHEIGDHPVVHSERIRAWPVRPAAAGAKVHFVGIWANEISGRKVKLPERPAGSANLS